MVQNGPARNEGRFTPTPSNVELTVGYIILFVVAHVIVKTTKWVWTAFSPETREKTQTKGSRSTEKPPAPEPNYSAQIAEPVASASGASIPSLPQSDVPSIPEESTTLTADGHRTEAIQTQLSQSNVSPALWKIFELDVSNLHYRCMEIRLKILRVFRAKLVDVEATIITPLGTDLTEQIRTKVNLPWNPNPKLRRRRMTTKYMHHFWGKYSKICERGQRLYVAYHNNTHSYTALALEIEKIKIKTWQLEEEFALFSTTYFYAARSRGKISKPPPTKGLRNIRRTMATYGANASVLNVNTQTVITPGSQSTSKTPHSSIDTPTVPTNQDLPIQTVVTNGGTTQPAAGQLTPPKPSPRLPRMPVSSGPKVYKLPSSFPIYATRPHNRPPPMIRVGPPSIHGAFCTFKVPTNKAKAPLKTMERKILPLPSRRPRLQQILASVPLAVYRTSPILPIYASRPNNRPPPERTSRPSSAHGAFCTLKLRSPARSHQHELIPPHHTTANTRVGLQRWLMLTPPLAPAPAPASAPAPSPQSQPQPQTTPHKGPPTTPSPHGAFLTLTSPSLSRQLIPTFCTELRASPEPYFPRQPQNPNFPPRPPMLPSAHGAFVTLKVATKGKGPVRIRGMPTRPQYSRRETEGELRVRRERLLGMLARLSVKDLGLGGEAR